MIEVGLFYPGDTFWSTQLLNDYDFEVQGAFSWSATTFWSNFYFFGLAFQSFHPITLKFSFAPLFYKNQDKGTLFTDQENLKLFLLFIKNR